jgi:putative spermidine/putrescine transport system permease protein
MKPIARLRPALPLLPFLAYLTIFLIIPTVTVVAGAFQSNGTFTLGNLKVLTEGTALAALRESLLLSAATALIGAVLGALLAYLLFGLPESSLLRRSVLSLCGVFAQFGGVVLAFSFIATFGFGGTLTMLIQNLFSHDIAASPWLYGVRGLIVVYTYFQIPLMVLVFMPALQGVRVQWREAAVNLGASTWQYWTKVAIPLLTPAFLGAALLLFANAFAAYATAAVLVSQGNPILPLLIRSALTSEVLLGRADLGFAFALEMIVVVAILMGLYALLLRRTARWMQ